MLPCMGVFHLDFALQMPKQQCDFLDLYFSLKTTYAIFLHGEPTLSFLKLNFFLAVHFVVEASSFPLNHNLALVSK